MAGSTPSVMPCAVRMSYGHPSVAVGRPNAVVGCSKPLHPPRHRLRAFQERCDLDRYVPHWASRGMRAIPTMPANLRWQLWPATNGNSGRSRRVGEEGLSHSQGCNEGRRQTLCRSQRYRTVGTFLLADAAFLVGLESSDAELLRHIDYRLRRPIWMLYLGRKAFVPCAPVWLHDGLKLDMSLEDALQEPSAYPRLARGRDGDQRARLVIEDPNQGSIIRPDQPISFMHGDRQFTARRVRMDFCILPEKTKEAT